MFYVRPVKKNDLEALTSLANEARVGLTTLPKDKKYLSKKINDSLRAFDEKVHKPGGENYLFVLVDSTTEEVMGTSSINSKLGGFKPFYTYKIITEHFEDPRLQIKKNVDVLHLTANHDGPSEICGLFVCPKYRSQKLGKLLSLCRFLFMAEFQERFDPKVISELRGISDESGKTPFWECVGKLFFEIEFAQADFLNGLGHKDFIKNLMPKYPIYIPMLPLSVQKVIGKVPIDTEPALYLLTAEGFVFENEVDLFDAGPTVSCPLSDIKAVKKSIKTTFAGTTTDIFNAKNSIITNARLDFRACLGKVLIQQNGSALLHPDTAASLSLNPGDLIRFS